VYQTKRKEKGILLQSLFIPLWSNCTMVVRHLWTTSLLACDLLSVNFWLRGFVINLLVMEAYHRQAAVRFEFKVQFSCSGG
jgi:hypothetical protein